MQCSTRHPPHALPPLQLPLHNAPPARPGSQQASGNDSLLFVEDRAGVGGGGEGEAEEAEEEEGAAPATASNDEQGSGEEGDGAGPGPGSSRQQQGGKRKARAGGGGAAWYDPADADLEVNVATQARLRKLRAVKEQAVLEGEAYTAALRKQHAVLNPRASWADLPGSTQKGRSRAAAAQATAGEDTPPARRHETRQGGRGAGGGTAGRSRMRASPCRQPGDAARGRGLCAADGARSTSPPSLPLPPPLPPPPRTPRSDTPTWSLLSCHPLATRAEVNEVPPDAPSDEDDDAEGPGSAAEALLRTADGLLASRGALPPHQQAAAGQLLPSLGWGALASGEAGHRSREPLG